MIIINPVFPKCQALSTTDSTKVLELIKRENPDLLVTDFNMPDMDGYELANQVWRIKDRLPIVFITGRPDNADVIDTLPNVSFRQTLMKPVTMAQIADALNRLPLGFELKCV